jgi:hypothetical protein
LISILIPFSFLLVCRFMMVNYCKKVDHLWFSTLPTVIIKLLFSKGSKSFIQSCGGFVTSTCFVSPLISTWFCVASLHVTGFVVLRGECFFLRPSVRADQSVLVVLSPSAWLIVPLSFIVHRDISFLSIKCVQIVFIKMWYELLSDGARECCFYTKIKESSMYHTKPVIYLLIVCCLTSYDCWCGKVGEWFCFWLYLKNKRNHFYEKQTMYY